MSHDIADDGTAAKGLVVPARVKSELAEQRALLGDDADMVACDEKSHRAVFVSEPHADVSEPAEIAQGDPTKAVDFVLADSEMGG